MSLEALEIQIKEQCEKAYWDILLDDISQEPVKTNHIKLLIDEVMVLLCSINPNRKDIHSKILNTFNNRHIIDELDYFILNLIQWIEKFQCANDDKKTNKWKSDFKNIYNQNNKEELSLFIIKFLKEYYTHIIDVKYQVMKLRNDINNNKNIFEEFKTKPENNKYGIPDNIRSGKDL